MPDTPSSRPDAASSKASPGKAKEGGAAHAKAASAARKKPAPRPRPGGARAGARPKRPVRRKVRRKAGGKKVNRRDFTALAVGWSMFTAAMAVGLTTVGRFLFPNVLTEPPSSFTAGFPDDFAIGVVDTRFKERYQVWVVRDEEKIYALSTICTHLGCTPNWLEAESKFKCPCHGSGFYITGINFEGPAPRPLERVAVSLAEDGQLLIDKSRLFKFEAGQWEDSASFLEMT